GVAVDVAQPADRLAGRGEPGAVAVAADLAVAGDAGVDAARVARVHLLGPEAPALHGAGAEVLEHDVGLRTQRGRELLPALGPQVERHRPLVAADDRPPQGVVVVPQPAPVPHRVAGPGRLHLDHLGTE